MLTTCSQFQMLTACSQFQMLTACSQFQMLTTFSQFLMLTACFSLLTLWIQKFENNLVAIWWKIKKVLSRIWGNNLQEPKWLIQTSIMRIVRGTEWEVKYKFRNNFSWRQKIRTHGWLKSRTEKNHHHHHHAEFVCVKYPWTANNNNNNNNNNNYTMLLTVYL